MWSVYQVVMGVSRFAASAAGIGGLCYGLCTCGVDTLRAGAGGYVVLPDNETENQDGGSETADCIGGGVGNSSDANGRSGRSGDCGDGTCCLPSFEFTCTDGADAVPNSARCDGWNDCADESDEDSCPVMDCTDLTDVPDWQCNGVLNCIDGVDELDCWTCEDNRDAIPNAWKCDGADDCGDESDEAGCPQVKFSDLAAVRD